VIESRFAEVSGLKMHYLVAGNTGTPVILPKLVAFFQ
jgi:hypothetical protein